MNTHFRMGTILPFIIILALVLSALTPGVAFAEGEAPESPALPPAELTQATADPVAEVPAAVSLLAENNAVLVQQDVVQPLASQSALTILCDPDPWFYCTNCPGGKSPVYASFALAVANWNALQGFGYIYMDSTPASTDPATVVINGSLPGMSTLKGLMLNPTHTYSTTTGIVNGSFEIFNFTKGFLVQGINIHSTLDNIAALQFRDNKGVIKIIDVEIWNTAAGGKGIYIRDHTGGIELERVNVRETKGSGAFMDNCGMGTTCTATGTIKITNSSFYKNGSANVNNMGLSIESASPIILNGVSAYQNIGQGAVITAYKTLTIKNSAFAETDNLGNSGATYGAGLRVSDLSTGSVTIENVLLSMNDGSGAWIQTSGNVTLKKVQALNNGYMGIRLGSIGSEVKTVNISDSVFTSNLNVNLSVYSVGAVMLTNVNASGSVTKEGANIQNSLAASALPITIINSVFNDNTGHGIILNSNGVVTINSISLNNNKGENGASITGKAITFLSSYGPNVIANNTKTGLYISTEGNLVMNNVQAYSNGQWGVTTNYVGGTILWNKGGAWNNGVGTTLGGGAELDNISTFGLVKNITLKDVVFDGNLDKGGLKINTGGMVTITNISASNNREEGILIYASAVSILRTLPTGANTINANNKGGLKIFADKNVTLLRIQADFNNDGNGAEIKSDAGSVNISGTTGMLASFSETNGDDTGEGIGLWIDAGGAVKLINVKASENYNSGAEIFSNAGVTISGLKNEFSGNSREDGTFTDSVGLKIVTPGSVTLLNTVAENNALSGASIDNRSGTGKVTINATVSGLVSSFSGNGGVGLAIDSKGAVTLNKVEASHNFDSGAEINNDEAPTSQKVTIFSSDFNGNHGDGLYVFSGGMITLNQLIASGNTRYGIGVENSSPSAGQVAQPVSVRTITANDNGANGLYIGSESSVTVINITANGNADYGLTIESGYHDNDKPVLVLGKNQFNENNGGIYIISKGIVTITGVEAGANAAEDGIYIETEKQVTISNSWIYGNYNGIQISYAPVTISNVTSMGNGYYGLNIQYVPVGGKVKLVNSSFIFNPNYYGFYISFDDGSEADFSMKNVTYYGNNLTGTENYDISY